MSAFNGNGNGASAGYDVIVVGGGHNGLTAAAYLQRAGLRTCVLEARDVLGTFTVSWVVLIIRGRLATIGKDVEEVAADLGAPPTHVVGRVLLPLLVPAMAASLLVAFALSIDDFVVSQYLASGADTTTVPMRIYSQARGGPTPALNALATIMLVVSLLALVLAYVVFRALTRGEQADRGSAFKQLATDLG